MRVQEQPNEFDDELRITIIGAGGIGSNLVNQIFLNVDYIIRYHFFMYENFF